MTDEDFANARVPATYTFDIRAFVPAAEVPDLYFDQPYYAAPQGRGPVKAYALLASQPRVRPWGGRPASEKCPCG